MSKSFTVLQVIPRMQAGGAELGCLQIAEALVKSGHRAIVASEGGQMEPMLETVGATHITLPLATKNPATLYANARRLGEIVQREGVDILHARSRAPAWSALWAARQSKIAFVTTYHSEYSEKTKIKNLYNSVMARSDTVIAVSDYMAHLIRTRYRTPEERIAIIHRAFDPQKFDPASVTPERIAAVRKLFDADGTKPILLLAGRITPRKAQHHLVEALGILRRNGGGELVCVFAGDIEKPEFKTVLEAAAKHLGVADQVRFPGHVADMAAAYTVTDISLNISEQEGLPRVAIEAQAMGVPMIVSDTGPGREVALTAPDVADSEASGLRVPYGDPNAVAVAIATLLACPVEKRKAYGTRGAKHVRAKFTLENLTTKTLAVYQRVLQRRGSA